MCACVGLNMDTNTEGEVYACREIKLPFLLAEEEGGVEYEDENQNPPEALDRETGQNRRGRDILIAIDHGTNSKHAFDWALAHFCRLADTIHLIHAVSDVNDQNVFLTTHGLMEKLAVEANQVAMVKTVGRMLEGDAGKVICREADRLKPAALIMGTHGKSLIRSVLQGSVSEYCFHHCKSVAIIIVPGNKRHQWILFPFILGRRIHHCSGVRVLSDEASHFL